MFTSRNTALALSAQPLSFMPRPRDAAAAPRAADVAAARQAARARAVAAQARFTDCMEVAMTALVFAAVCLFGAALLRAGVPACQARRIGVFALYGIAGGCFAAMVVLVARGVAQLGQIGRG